MSASVSLARSSGAGAPSLNASTGVARVGQYSHLDQDTPIKIKSGEVEVHLTAAAIVEGARRANYGVHRLLSELVKQSAEDARRSGNAETPLMTAIREQLEAGEVR